MIVSGELRGYSHEINSIRKFRSRGVLYLLKVTYFSSLLSALNVNRFCPAQTPKSMRRDPWSDQVLIHGQGWICPMYTELKTILSPVPWGREWKIGSLKEPQWEQIKPRLCVLGLLLNRDRPSLAPHHPDSLPKRIRLWIYFLHPTWKWDSNFWGIWPYAFCIWLSGRVLCSKSETREPEGKMLPFHHCVILLELQTPFLPITMFP